MKNNTILPAFAQCVILPTWNKHLPIPLILKKSYFIVENDENVNDDFVTIKNNGVKEVHSSKYFKIFKKK